MSFVSDARKSEMNTRHHLEVLLGGGEKLNLVSKKGKPREAHTYRGARRNEARKNHQLPWHPAERRL